MPRPNSGHARRLKWGDGWIAPRTNKAGEPRFLARWRDADGRTHAKTFRTETEAETHLRDVADRQAASGYVPPERITVRQLLDAFLERAAHRITPGTLGQWRSRARSLVCPTLGGVFLSDLTAPRVQHWIDQLVRRGLAAETIVGARRLLSGACKEAVVLGMLATNPVTGTRTPAIKSTPVDVWTAEEVRRVLAVAAADPLLDAAYRVALSTGIRPGELLALRWSDVDLVRGVLAVKRTRTLDEHYRDIEGETTKGKRQRAIALVPSTVMALKAWRKAQAEMRLAAESWEEPDLVLTDDCGRRMRREAWAHLHDAVIVVAGVPRVTPHSMRHSYATLELEAGMHPKIVSERLGHRSVSFTLDRYSQISVSLQETAIRTLERSLFATDERDNTASRDDGKA